MASQFGSQADKLSFVPLDYLNAPTVENAILAAPRPVDLGHNDLVSVNGEHGVWTNKNESENWRGDVPLSHYPINDDSHPEVIRKKTDQLLVYEQEVAIRYLRPPTPPPPGDIVLKELEAVLTPPAPPLVIRQQPPRPETPPPVIIREAPPQPPKALPPKIIPIPGKKLPPPPRKVVVERLPQLPTKPQSVIIERWLPFKEPKRRVVFARNTVPEPVVEKPKNVIIQWETPQVHVKKEYRDLGVIRASPDEYVHRYGESLKNPVELPSFVREIRPPTGVALAAEHQPAPIPQLEGDLDALRLIDLEREGLGEYKYYLPRPASTLPVEAPQKSASQASLAPASNNQSKVNLALSRAHLYDPTLSRTHLHDALLKSYLYDPTHSRPYYYDYGLSRNSYYDYGLSRNQYYDIPFIEKFLTDAYAGYDKNTNFKISRSEATILLNGINKHLSIYSSDADVKRFVESFDATNTGFLDFQDFKRAVLRRFGGQ